MDVTGVAWFAGDEEARRRSFGRRWLQPFPAAKEAGKRGGLVSEPRQFQIEEEERQRGPVLGDRRRLEAAELELDLELGLVWRGVSGVGG